MIVIQSREIRKMIQHSEEERPKEACGILGGKVDGDRVRILKVYQCENVHPNPTLKYLIRPEDQVKVFEEIEKDENVDLVGFYHSHPRGPDAPSRIDYSRNYWPGYLIAIVSLSPKAKLSFWRWRDGEFLEEGIVGERF